jgi:beta-lactamase class D
MNKTLLSGLLVWLVLAMYSVSFADEKDFTFVLKTESDGQLQVINKQRAQRQLTPFSTFKIPNTLILLEKGLVKDMQQQFSIDETRYPRESWWFKRWYEKPLNIRDAFQYSALPLYQQLSADAGKNTYQQYLPEFGYGNQDVSSAVDQFWLNKSLKISAIQQVEFLQKLYNGKLPLSSKTLSTFKDIMLVEATDEYKLYAKTGAGMLGKGHALGWYVGFVERNDDVYYFAVNTDAESFQKVQPKRIEIARQNLKAAGVL